mgnify:FL=1
MKNILIGTLLISLAITSHAQQSSVHINHKTYQYPEAIQNFDAMWQLDSDALQGYSLLNPNFFDGRFYAFMQFNEIPNHEQRTLLENAGIHFLSYIPDITYAVSFLPGTSSQLLSMLKVRGVYDASAS